MVYFGDKVSSEWVNPVLRGQVRSGGSRGGRNQTGTAQIVRGLMVRGRTSQDVACRQDAHSVNQVADAVEELFWLEREAKEAREHTGLKEVFIQTLVLQLIFV